MTKADPTNPEPFNGTAAVLAECFIANPMQPVLDPPMTTVEFEQALGISLLA